MRLESIYADYVPEYSIYFVRSLILLKSMYGKNYSGNLFSDELTEWLIESGFILYQFSISIYYKYAPNGERKMFYLMLTNCVYWYIAEDLVKRFVDTLGNILHVNFLGFYYLFM